MLFNELDGKENVWLLQIAESWLNVGIIEVKAVAVVAMFIGVAPPPEIVILPL